MNIGDSKTFKSRYNQTRTITKTGDSEYLLEGASAYCRGGSLNNGAKFFDLDGGPLVAVGDRISFLEVDDARRITNFEGLDCDREDCIKIKITVA